MLLRRVGNISVAEGFVYLVDLSCSSACRARPLCMTYETVDYRFSAVVPVPSLLAACTWGNVLYRDDLTEHERDLPEFT